MVETLENVKYPNDIWSPGFNRGLNVNTAPAVVVVYALVVETRPLIVYAKLIELYAIKVNKHKPVLVIVEYARKRFKLFCHNAPKVPIITEPIPEIYNNGFNIVNIGRKIKKLKRMNNANKILLITSAI